MRIHAFRTGVLMTACLVLLGYDFAAGTSLQTTDLQSLKNQVDQAKSQYASGLFDSASRILRNVMPSIEALPKADKSRLAAEAHFYLGCSLLGLSSAAESSEEFRKCLQADPSFADRVTAETMGPKVARAFNAVRAKLSGAGPGSPSAPASVESPQTEIEKTIRSQIDSCKRSIQGNKNTNQSISQLDDLSQLVLMKIEDRKTQKELATEILYWMGIGYANQNNRLKALSSFKNMFDIDRDYAMEISSYNSDPKMIRLLQDAGAGTDQQAKLPPAVPESQTRPVAEKVPAPATLQAWADPTTGLEFVWIPPGEFRMGSYSGLSYPDEQPVHRVSLDGFWMGKHEVTVKVWQLIMGSYPSFYLQSNDRAYIDLAKEQDTIPANGVSWNEIQSFIQRLDDKGEAKFRLPTEAEWEYACRAGTSEIPVGSLGSLKEVAWFDLNSEGHVHPVGQLAPNAFGLYDMLGNVWEWCQDWKDNYSPKDQPNPTGPSQGHDRVYRGGGFKNNNTKMRPSYRRGATPNEEIEDVGFRLVREK